MESYTALQRDGSEQNSEEHFLLERSFRDKWRRPRKSLPSKSLSSTKTVRILPSTAPTLISVASFQVGFSVLFFTDDVKSVDSDAPFNETEKRLNSLKKMGSSSSEQSHATFFSLSLSESVTNGSLLLVHMSAALKLLGMNIVIE
jgi:hypothetical protein